MEPYSLPAEEGGFDLLITSDQELSYQQNLTAKRIAVLVLSTNNGAVIKERIQDIAAAIEAIPAAVSRLWISDTVAADEEPAPKPHPAGS